MIQRSLVGGEIAPVHYPRTNLEKYSAALRTLRNMIIRKEGGASNRFGSFYIYGETGVYKPIGAVTQLVPWVSSIEADSYILEFGNGFIRFVKDGAQVEVSSVTAWSNATNYVIGDLAVDAGVNYYCIAAHINQQPPNATYWYALEGDIYEIPTPYTNTLLQERGGITLSQYQPDRMLITHNSVPVKELVRSADTNWILRTLVLNPSINPPINLTADAGSGVGKWKVTAVTILGEESIASDSVTGGDPSVSSITVGWDSGGFATGESGTLRGYNVYRAINNVYYFIGFTTATSFEDDDAVTPTPDSKTPPETRGELTSPGAGEYPDKCGLFQGRTLLANFSFNTQAVYMSKSGQRRNFSRTFPSTDDDSILVQTRGKRPSGIQALVDLNELLALTESGVFVVSGSQSGVLTPTEAFPKQLTSNPVDDIVQPIVTNRECIYTQRGANILRACGFGEGGFFDTDITAFASHLFDGKTVVSWALQQAPHSILWVVLSDGTMAAVTYIREQNILGWHRHDTDGVIEQVCAIPEGNEDAIYIVVKRTINGSDVRYMERMYSRNYSDIVDAVPLDCALTYDGRNTAATTMTLTGGTNWDQDETLTLTASVSTFVAGDVGNEIWITGTDEIDYRLSITAYTSGTVVSVRPDKTIPTTSGIRGVATTDWARAVDGVTGLDHLEGASVGVIGNGYVVASPNNPNYDTITVSSGEITLPRCYSVIHVGLPYISDIQTLDIDVQGPETLANKKMLVNNLNLHVSETSALWLGTEEPPSDDPTDGLTEQKIRDTEDWEARTTLQNDIVETVVQGRWGRGGRVFVRNVDPTPVTVNAIIPEGNFEG